MSMNKPIKQTEGRRIATALSAWENEGGAPGRDFIDHQYGRRIEADRSWTIYHVFTGSPASFDGEIMTGLSRMDATDGMLRLNLRSLGHSDNRIQLSSLKSATETAASGS